MSTKTVLLSTLFILQSCSLVQSEKEISFSSVDVNKSVKIYNKPYISQKRSSLNSVGPIVDGEEVTGDDESNIIAVVLGDSLYKSFSYLPILECLKEEGVNYHYISGLGFSSLIATLYSLEGSVESIEWKIHKLQKLIKRDIPYTKSWYRKVSKFIDSEVSIKNMEQASRPLLFTSYHFKDKEIRLKSRGRLKDEILANVSFSRLVGDYKTPLQSSPSEILKEYRKRADYIIYINAIGSKIKISKLGGFPLSYYTKLVGYLENEETGSDLDLKIQLDEYEIDDINNLNDFVDVGREFCRNHISSVSNLFKNEKVKTE